MKKSDALAWLQLTPRATGECDRCHKEQQPLYYLPGEIETEQEAEWMYCPSCFRALVAKLTTV